MSDPKKSDPQKPVLDEQALDKLLEAAFVIQEHGGDVPWQARNQASANQQTNRIPPIPVPAIPIAASAAAANRPSLAPENSAAEKLIPEKSAAEKHSVAGPVPAAGPASISSASPGKDAYTLALGQIVETQQQILTRHLELESAMALVAQRAAEITRASGSAIGIVEDRIVESQPDAKNPGGKKLQYRAVSGLLALARGSEVAMEKALCFNCLRSGEVIRCSDVNSDFLLDAEECRRRGIASLIAVPIYRDSGIAGALELYYASANTFTEQDVHSGQLMAGLVTEALARDAGVSSRKSLAAERATMLEALEKLRPNLAALMESSAVKESIARSAAPAAAGSAAGSAASGSGPSKAAKTAATTFSPTVPAATAPIATIPKKAAATAFFCRKCGHELVGEEMFCGKCGSPRTSEYQPPTMQSKVASLWQMQQASKPSKASAAQAPVNGSVRPAERKNNQGLANQGLANQGVPLEIQPWEAVLSELSDPFGEPEAAQELEAEWKPAQRTEPAAPLRNEVIEISAAARKFSAGVDAPGLEAPGRENSIKQERIENEAIEDGSIQEKSTENKSFENKSIENKSIEEKSLDQKLIDLGFINNDSIGQESIGADAEAELPREAELEADAETTARGAAGIAALATAHPLTWSSAAKAKAAFEQLAASKNQNSFVRFWNTRRGDIYLAVAVVLVAAVIRWSMGSAHSFGANGNAAAKVSHRRPAPDADLSTFDKLLISLGLAEAPDPVEDKGNPDTQVWVDLHTALYYCPGTDLYGKTPQGKYSSQREAQLGQFEPAYRKACE